MVNPHEDKSKMPTRYVVRIDPAANDGSGLIVTIPSTGNDYSSPSSLFRAAAAAASGIGLGQDDGTTTATDQTTSDSKKSAGTFVHDKIEEAISETKDMTKGKSHPEGKILCRDMEAEAVSTSTTAQSSCKTLRREDFNSALEYLEAKYVKSIVNEDDTTGNSSEQAAAAIKSLENEVKISDSNDQMKNMSGEAHLLEKRARVQNTESDDKTKNNLCKDSEGESDDASFGSGEKIVEGVGNSAEAKKELPVESVVKKLTIAAPGAASNEAGLLSAEESSPSEPKNVAESALPSFEHLPQPPQGQNQNNKGTSNGLMPHRYIQGYGHWPQRPPPRWPFPPHPFGMMYPPYPYPSPYFGMPPIVPQAPLSSPPNQGKNNTTQPPDAGKNKVEKEAKPKVKGADAVDNVVNSSSSSEANSPVIPALPALPPIDMKALQQDSLVEKAKMLVQQEILAEKGGKKKQTVVQVPFVALPPLSAFPPLPPVQDITQLQLLPTASAVDQSTPGSCKKMKGNSDSAHLFVVTAKNALVEANPIPPVQDMTQLSVLPTASAVDQSFSSSRKKLKVNSDSARLSAVTAKMVQVENLPLLGLPPLSPVQDTT
mmetsp:Transcript_24387/g.38273  ORF Transcript_24387/g.38273 Transcript_24387/m.38273 type:complete len:599 (-) Transcript_24387:218-2014(-)